MNGNETLLCCNCRGLTRYCRVQLTVRKYARNNMTVPRIFESLVKKHPDRVCFIFEDTKWTFREVCSLYFIYIYIYKDIDICKTILKNLCKRAGWLRGQHCELPSVETRVRFQPKSKLFFSKESNNT